MGLFSDTPGGGIGGGQQQDWQSMLGAPSGYGGWQQRLQNPGGGGIGGGSNWQSMLGAPPGGGYGNLPPFGQSGGMGVGTQQQYGMPQDIGGYGGGVGGYGGSYGGGYGGYGAQPPAPLGSGNPGNTNHDSQDIRNRTITTVTPWDPQGEELKKLYAGYDQNYTDQMKLGPLGFDPASTQALNRMQRMASGPNQLVNSATGAVGDIASGQDHITTGGMFARLAQQPGISTGGYRSMFDNNTQGPGSLGEGAFNEVASGSLMASNPYREAAIARSEEEARNNLNSQFTGAGRYTGRMGSSAYGDAYGRQVAGIGINARMQGYDTDTQNMMAAAQARSGEGLARQGLGLQALQGSTGVQEQNRQFRGSMTQAQTGVQQANEQNRLQAAGMASQMNALRYDDPTRLAQVGGAREDMAQQQRDFQAKQLGAWQSGIGGLPGQAGTSTTQQPGQSWWQKLLGIGGAGLGLAGMFG